MSSTKNQRGVIETTRSTIKLQTGTTAEVTIDAGAAVTDIVVGLPATSDTLVGRETTDTLENKTISGLDNTFTNLPSDQLTADPGDEGLPLVVQGDGSLVPAVLENEATSATAENTAEAIVARDVNGNFKANDITIFEGTGKELDVGAVLFDLASTGAATFDGFTPTSGNTTFTVGAGTGQIFDHVTDEYFTLTWTAFTGQALAISTGITYVFLKRDGTLSITSTQPTPNERRDKIFLGRIGALSGVITGYSTNLITSGAVNADLFDLGEAIAAFKLDGGLIPSSNGANLTISRSSGYVFQLGINFIVDPNNPNLKLINAVSAPTLILGTQTAVTSTSASIDPTNYDLAGTVTAIGGSNNQATIVRFYQFVGSSTSIAAQYGQAIYSSLSAAVQAIASESFVVNPFLTGNSILIGVLCVTKGCTSLADTTTARFFTSGKFGDVGVGASGASVSTIQNVYNNSTSPELLTDSTRGAFSIKRGSAADTDNIYEGVNGSDVTTFSVAGNGLMTAVNIIASGLTATTVPYLNASKQLTSSAVTPTQLSYLDATSSIQTQLNAKASTTDLTTHEADTSTHGVTTVAGLSEVQVFTNKDYDGGTATNARRITVPQAALATLTALARKEGTLVYATDMNALYIDDGASLLAIPTGTPLANPMTTVGDMLVGGAAGVVTRLPVGTAGQMLVQNSTPTPAWTNTFGPASSNDAHINTMYGSLSVGADVIPSFTSTILRYVGNKYNSETYRLDNATGQAGIALRTGQYFDGTTLKRTVALQTSGLIQLQSSTSATGTFLSIQTDPSIVGAADSTAANGVIAQATATGAWTLGTLAANSGLTVNSLNNTPFTIASANAAPFMLMKYSSTTVGFYLGTSSALAFSFNNGSLADIGSASQTGAWTFGPSASSPQHVFNTGSTVTSTLTNGQIHFGNSDGSSAWPTISGCSTTANKSGLYFVSGTNDSNSGVDMSWDVRESDGTDFATLTTSAFQWQRFGTILGSITRNGAAAFISTSTTVGHTFTSPTAMRTVFQTPTGNSLSTGIDFKSRNSGGTQTTSSIQNDANSLLAIYSGTTFSLNSNLAATPVQCLSGDTAGALQFGPNSANANYSGQRHMVSGGLFGANVGSNSGSAELVIGSNVRYGGNTSGNGRTSTGTTGGCGLIFINPTVNTNSCFKLFANIIADGTGTDATVFMTMTAQGAFTWGGNTPVHTITGGGITNNVLHIGTSGSGDSANHGIVITKVDAGTTSSNKFIGFQVNAGVTASGAIGAAGAAAAGFTTLSDERLKMNIVPLTSQLENICALRFCEFDYRDGSGHQIGQIAQDLQKIYPDSVSVEKNGMLAIVGWSRTDARIGSAIQEQQKLILELQARIAVLENR